MNRLHDRQLIAIARETGLKLRLTNLEVAGVGGVGVGQLEVCGRARRVVVVTL